MALILVFTNKNGLVLLRFSRHRSGTSGYIVPREHVCVVPCPKSFDYLQHAEEGGKCDCGADDVQELIYRIDDALRTDTAYGGLG